MSSASKNEMSKYYLNFVDQDIENLWLYTQIDQKKKMLLLGLLYCTLLNLSSDPFTIKNHGIQHAGVVSRIIIIFLIYVFVYDIYSKKKWESLDSYY